MGNFRNNKAITLIALVITIIILIILAAISINVLFGKEGLIEKTKWSAFTTDLSRIEESVMVTQKISDDGTTSIDAEKAFDGNYDGQNVTLGFKRAVVEERENNLDSQMTDEEISSKYESYKDENGKIKDLYYVKENIAKKSKEYVYDTVSNTVLKVSATKIFGKDYHLYRIGSAVSGSSLNIAKPNGANLGEHKGLEEDWIPIYTIENYKKIATDEQNYDIYDLNGTKVGTYNMNKNSKYRLMNDLDFTGRNDIDSIKGFKGTFDGNAYYIKNITLDRTASTDSYMYYSTDLIKTGDVSEITVGAPAGLFDRIESGIIENLGVDNAKITGIANVGVISGEIVETTVQNCLIKNSTAISNGATKSGASGGLIGWVYKKENPSTIKNITMNSNNVKGASVTSGLVAFSTSSISIADSLVENCTIDTQATNTTSNDESQGGILGLGTENIAIQNCYVGKSTFKNNLTQAKVGNTCGGILGSTYCNGSYTTTISKSSIEDSELAFAQNNAGIIGCSLYGTAQLTISECNVQNLKLNAYTAGGILGFQYGSWSTDTSLNIINCNVNKLKTEENLLFVERGNGIAIGGITGFLYTVKNSNIENSNVTNSTISISKLTKSSCTSVAGLLGGNSSSSNYTETLKKCNVENTTVKVKLNVNSSTYCSSNINVAGIVGTSDFDIDSCNLKNSKVILEGDAEFTGNYDSTGEINGANACGIIGTNCGPTSRNNKISNCKITNSEISNNYGKSMGIIDFNYYQLEVSNCSIEDSKIFGKVSTAGVTEYSRGKLNIDSMNIKNTSIISEIRHASGIVTFAYNYVSITNCNVDNCTIGNLKAENSKGMSSTYIKNGGNVAGIIGYPYGSTINNCNVTNTKLTSHYNNLGGISSFCASALTSCNAKNLTIISDGDNVGGIFGISTYGANIDDCSVEGGTITAKGVNVGGIAGAHVSSAVFKNSNVKDLTINTENSFVGGIVGLSFLNEFTDGTVNNVTINTPGKYVGGISGWAYIGNKGITNCDVTSCKINTENHSVGGLFGCCENSAIISLCDVTSTEVNGKDTFVGGIAGMYKGYYNASSPKAADILNCNVSNSKITITGTDATSIGGIVGNGTNSKGNSTMIDTCNVTKTEITGVDYVGGISGVASTSIKNCKVDEQSKITGRNFVGGIQGFGGIHGSLSIGYDYWNYSNSTWSTATAQTKEISVVTNIDGCSIKNSTITGTTDVNYIQGKNSYYADDWTGDVLQDSLTNNTYESVTINNAI